MLTITVPAATLFNDATNEFIYTKEQTLQLEHSLVSISKWEAKWKKPFLDKRAERTEKETIDYIRCMTLTQNVDPNVYLALTNQNFKDIGDYISDAMTATTFTDLRPNPPKQGTVTSEVLYYQMVALQIPWECQKWHINRLLTLIRVCSIKNGPSKKMSINETYAYNHNLNEARKKALGIKG